MKNRPRSTTWTRMPELTKEDGHVYVTMIDDWGRKVDRMVAELVLEAFVGPRPSPLHRVYHRNGQTHDNRLTNLEWRLPTIVPEPSVN
jgi:HNH endonuclease